MYTLREQPGQAAVWCRQSKKGARRASADKKSCGSGQSLNMAHTEAFVGNQSVSAFSDVHN
jgi:hypothetical protein